MLSNCTTKVASPRGKRPELSLLLISQSLAMGRWEYVVISYTSPGEVTLENLLEKEAYMSDSQSISVAADKSVHQHYKQELDGALPAFASVTLEVVHLLQ